MRERREIDERERHERKARERAGDGEELLRSVNNKRAAKIVKNSWGFLKSHLSQ